MPGICGFANETLAADASDRLERMRGALKLAPWQIENHHLDPGGSLAFARVSLGFVDREPQPARNEDGSLLAMMTGEILDAEAHRRRLAQAGHVFRDDSSAELLLHGFEAEGTAFFGRLEGQFAAAIWDANRKRLLLVNDRWGIKPVYYATVGGELRFASAIGALLSDGRLSRRDHPRGIAQFFTFGHLLGEDTMLQDVRLLPAAGWLEFDVVEGRLTVDRYWKLRAAVEPLTDSEHLDRIDLAFKTAVDRCSAGSSRLGISLSGGLDSRAILALIDPEREVQSLSMGMKGSLDHLSANRMAELTGRKHHQVLLDERFLTEFETHMARMVRLTDGHYLSQCIVMPTLPVYRELGIETLLRGHAGELMHMSKAYNFSLRRTNLSMTDADLEPWLMGRLRGFIADPQQGSMFVPEFAREVETLARESLRDCLRESEGLEPPIHRVWHLFLAQRVRRETGMSMVEFNSVAETRLPYLDSELVAALMAAPPRLKLDETMQSHILKKRRPALLGVVNANTGAKVGASELTRTVSRFRLKVLSKLGAPGYQPYERLGLWLKRELRPLVERRLVAEAGALGELFDPQALRTIVADHFAGRANNTYAILAAMIFAVGKVRNTEQ